MAECEHVDHGFEPVFDERSRVLVLGSFPSVLSRANDFYYGNPRNRFWVVLASCARAPVPQTIAEKRALLLASGVALWDVVASCDVAGSSDTSIKNVVPVDIARVTSVVSIERVICNGGTAGRLYRRHLERTVGIKALVLPSTSPANAAWSLPRLVEAWSPALDLLAKDFS